MTRRRMGTLAVIAVIGLQMNDWRRVPTQLAQAHEAGNPTPTRTVDPKAGHARGSRHDTDSSRSTGAAHGDDAQRPDARHYEPPTGSSRDSGPGSGEGL
jgi:hypothetical protein